MIKASKILLTLALSATLSHTALGSKQEDLIVVGAFDGGGARGVIPAIFARNLEKKLNGPISSYFDRLGGTSTGALIAMGLAVPNETRTAPKYMADDIVQIYTGKAQEIFPGGWLNSFKSYFKGSRYTADGLEKVLGETFGETLLHDALTDIIIPAYCTHSVNPLDGSLQPPTSYYFKRDKKPIFTMKSIARSTSAAPTYFPPAFVQDSGNNSYTFWDGGLFENNPARCTYTETLKQSRKAGTDSDIMLFSFGTGSYETSIASDELSNKGTLSLIQPIFSAMFDGQSDAVDHDMRFFLKQKNGVDRYLRLQPPLPKGQDAMDDTDPKHLNNLIMIAEQHWKNNEGRIDPMVQEIKQRKKDKLSIADNA